LKLIVILAGLILYAMSLGTTTTEAHLIVRPKDKTTGAILKSQKTNLAHSRYVCRHGGGYHKRWSCHAVKWLSRELGETRARITPVYSASSLREWIRRNDPCAYQIIDRETAGSWDVQEWNDQGSGAYGWPQALPASKMRSAGADYMTNPYTQYRWMKGYVNGRYGGSCGALAFHNANGWY
jgi:hypothetical protein